MSIPVLDLSLAEDPKGRASLLHQLRDALFNVGFLYITNHGVPEETISDLVEKVPALFEISEQAKLKIAKINSPHFLGYSGFAEETTQGKSDLREQFDFATELPVVYHEESSNLRLERDFSQLYWRLRGPNQWPDEEDLPGFKEAFLKYQEALSDLSYRFVHLVEEAFDIPFGTFDSFFAGGADQDASPSVSKPFLGPQHRIKIVKYHVVDDEEGQGVGAHKDSSGWLTFLYQVGNERGLEVFSKDGSWIPANPVPSSFVVNFGNAFEAATEGAVRATIHRVKAPTERVRYSIPFFMGLPLDAKVSEITAVIPEQVRSLRKNEVAVSETESSISTFLDPRWDNLGESQLRKWIRSHKDVGLKWYGPAAVEYYTQ